MGVCREVYLELKSDPCLNWLSDIENLQDPAPKCWAYRELIVGCNEVVVHDVVSVLGTGMKKPHVRQGLENEEANVCHKYAMLIG